VESSTQTLHRTAFPENAYQQWVAYLVIQRLRSWSGKGWT